MNFFREFRNETRTLLIVALAAVVIAVGGVFLLQAGLGPSSPTPQPSAAPAVPRDQAELDFAGWQTYRSDEFGFVYSSDNWTIVETSKNAVELKSKKEASKISIYSNRGDSSSVSTDGLTYCGAYPNLCQREAFDFFGDQSTIIWRTVQGNSNASVSISLENGSTISVWFYTFADRFDKTDRETFKDFLATFRFTP